MNDEEWAEYKRTGIIPFAEQVFWSFQGDRVRADSLRGLAMQVVNRLKAAHPTNKIASDALRLDDGSIIQVNKAYNFIYVTVFCPEKRQLKPNQEPVNLPVLQPGQFFYIPGCRARYSFKNEDLQNEIYIKPGTIDPSIDTTNTGQGATFLSLKDAGLSSFLPSPDGSILRPAKVCYLEGAEPDTGYSGGRLQMSSYNLPTSGAFSVSALVRLRKPIEMDYSFTSKTKELDCGYTVWNPIKPRILTSKDGETWSAVCPGSAVPLIGWHIPSRFSKHWVRFTYPWPSYNDNFVANADNQIGYREIGTVCDGEPLMASAYDAASPYWDKVEAWPYSESWTLGGAGDVRVTYHGEGFEDFHEENAQSENTAPYASYCTLILSRNGYYGDPYINSLPSEPPVGMRCVAYTSDGDVRYGTVISTSLEGLTSGGYYTTERIVIKDYEYKKYMKDATPNVAFGNCPFPVSHPQGYMIGTNFLGLMWYNGNRIIAGKVCDFESEYNLSPIVSNELELNVFYHACFTFDAKGNCALYITKRGDTNTVIYKSTQSTQDFGALDGFSMALKVPVGADDFMMAPSANSPPTDYTSQWEFSSCMDISMMRFYHHALTREEAVLLAKEAFGHAFVADDDEAGMLQANGLKEVVV